MRSASARLSSTGGWVGETGGALSRRTYLIELAFFGGSSGVFQGSRLLVGLVAAAAVPPERFAIWGAALAIFGYSAFATLGVLNGANREVPVSLGAGDTHSALSTERAALSWSVATALVLAVVGAAAASLLPLNVRVAGLLIVACVSLQQLYLFYQTTLRSRLEFNRASFVQLVVAVAFAAVAVPVVAAAEVEGLILAQAVAFLLASAVAWWFWRRRFVPAWDIASVRRLAREGMPIMAGGAVFALIASADRWLVLSLLGDDELGHYTIAALVSGVVLFIATIVGQQFYPRMAMAFGASRDRRAVWRAAMVHALIAFAVTVPVAALAIVLSPILVAGLLPQYGSAIPALQLLSLAYVIAATTSGLSNGLIVLGRAPSYVLWLLVALGVEVALGTLAALTGLGLPGIAGACVLAYGVLAIGVVTTMRRATRQPA